MPFDQCSFYPSQLRKAYGITASGLTGKGATVAIVDAYDDPNAETDLADYRTQYGLPACTTANGCFAKADQRGDAGPLPAPNPGWGIEISLDLDMVSAGCPHCHILLVEATTNLNTDLYTAEDTAARLGANAISNSYGGGESSSETSQDVHFNHPGVAITASSGDDGFGVSYPAASRYLTAVGGTSLTRGGGTRGWTESAWSGAGSGCSAYEPKPAWQTDSGCSRRTSVRRACALRSTDGNHSPSSESAVRNRWLVRDESRRSSNVAEWMEPSGAAHSIWPFVVGK